MVAAQVVHGAIVGTGFVPYFVLEAFGISLPFVGLPDLDSTYEWTPMVQLLLLMLATFSMIMRIGKGFWQSAGCNFLLKRFRTDFTRGM